MDIDAPSAVGFVVSSGHSIHNTPFEPLDIPPLPKSAPAPWFQAIIDPEQKKARDVEVVEDESMEEQAGLELGDLELRKMMGLRDELLRRLGYPSTVDKGKLVPGPSWDPRDGQNPSLRSRHLVVNRNNCQDVDIDGFLGLNKPLDKKEFLAKEEGIWRAAMDHWKSKNMGPEYDLIPYNISLYPVVFESRTWYHCNLLAQQREISPQNPTLFFVELNEVIEAKCAGAITYTVVACVPLDCVDAEINYVCNVCPRSIGVVHPRNGGFICGSQEGQKVFHYTIPGPTVVFSDDHQFATTSSCPESLTPHTHHQFR